ncbi:cytochrome c oxidase assembly protein [Micrococcoides hystricis]|uniref:Cytochrome c oxidase assembly protein n=1 Tax=Micrococcoides hystricis TaxID=1572761 RepID=A0ABV6PCV6_9MICC
MASTPLIRQLNRITYWVLPAGIALTLAVLVGTMAATGLNQAGSIVDAGALTRWALPVFTTTSHTAMTITLGALIVATTLLPHYTRIIPRADEADKPGRVPEGERFHPVFASTLKIAAVASMVWTIAALGTLVFSFSDLSGMPVSASEGFSGGFIAFAQQISVGQAWLAVTLIAAVTSTLVMALRSYPGLFLTALLGFTAIIPLALIGHSAGGDDHYAAVNSILLHLIGVIAWAGGLIVLAILGPKLLAEDKVLPRSKRAGARQGSGERSLMATVVARYSVLAMLGIITVAISGIVNAQIRMEHWHQIASPWGMMVLTKLVLTMVLGVIGFIHRQWLIPKLGGNDGKARGLFWWLVAAEVLIMGAVMAVAVVLGSTAPPKPEEISPNASPARILTGYELPPEFTLEQWWLQWRWDWLWIAITIFLAVWYVRAMLRLRARGDNWSLLRTVSFLLGLLLLFYTTSGALTVYGMVLFSAHMIEHMTLTMIIPIFLVLGMPITLALKSLPVRTDGSWGPREWILWLIQSPWAKFFTNPVVASANVAGSIVAFYFTPFFNWAVSEHPGHEFMIFHFLFAGYIFTAVMIGEDPLPTQPPYPLRLVLLFVTMAMHAFISLAITTGDNLLAADWYGNMGRPWGPDAITDQHLGGSVMWGIGELPTLAMAVIVAVIWARQDKKEAVRQDRQADRDHDAELAAYNEMFAVMAEQDESADRKPGKDRA